MKKLLLPIAFALFNSTAPFALSIPIGTYTVDYHDNAAGQYTDFSNPDYSKANPYYGNLIAPGPIFINAVPGTYEIIVESGLGNGVWSGDATGGTFLTTGHAPGESVTFNHTFGQIALYYWDWYPYDNPHDQTTVSLYRIESSIPDGGATALLLLTGITGLSLMRRQFARN